MHSQSPPEWENHPENLRNRPDLDVGNHHNIVKPRPQELLEGGGFRCGGVGAGGGEWSGSPAVIRRSTSKCEKRRTGSGMKDGKRRRLDIFPAALSGSPPPSSPTTTTDMDATTPPFAFNFESLSSTTCRG
ncbi:hypothetical protein R3P38DRAFT_2814087 [Favolaschia claudopus]|uniref:Uncharacterized protein n=1 Tax=Favolaschia claudopus TaxID=2862362 RepID=A0AAV9Z3Y8_9AGAR